MYIRAGRRDSYERVGSGHIDVLRYLKSGVACAYKLNVNGISSMPGMGGRS